MSNLKPALILASASPRRLELLNLIGLRHRVVPATVDEVQLAAEAPTAFALRMARSKARAIAHLNPEALVLAADTVVDVDGVCLGKPRDRCDAARMLRLLSGRGHLVHTAMALIHVDLSASLIDTAEVVFSTLSTEMIQWYLDTGEPMDKAGAYAVQGIGGLLVRSVSGSPHTVIGLPIQRMAELYSLCGLSLLSSLEAPPQTHERCLEE
jgi:septum formation protein